MCTHHSRSTPYPLHGANEVRLLQGPGGWRGLSRAGWAGRAGASESPSAPSPSPPSQPYSPIPFAADLAFIHVVPSLQADSAFLPRSSRGAWPGETWEGGSPPTAFVPCWGLRSGRWGARRGCGWITSAQEKAAATSACLRLRWS